MCDCENMTTSVRDEKIALVFETVFEEHAGDEGEVNSHCTFNPITVHWVKTTVQHVCYRSNGTNCRKCSPYWEEGLGRKGS